MNLLITGAWQQASENIEVIKQMGHSVVFLQNEKDELPCDYKWVEAIIGNGIFLYHSIELFTNLRYIQLTSAGFDRVPLDYIKEHQIEIHNARGVYSIPMAEFAVAGVLQLYKKMDFFRENQKKHEWNKRRDCFELFGKTVCIVGCGNVGTECAKRFSVFGCKVMGVDLFVKKDQNYCNIVGLEELDVAIQNADIVVLTLPLTKETKQLINKERLELMKNDAILVNIARGGIVDGKALIEYMDKLGGAVLDVFEQEPLDESSPFWNMSNVIITPHNSFVGDNNSKRLTEVIITNLNEKELE